MSDSMTMAELMSQYKTNDDLSNGDVVSGKVLSVNSDEVIVNINYAADGILPKEEIEGGSTDGISIGDEISVFVVKVNDGEGSVLLSKKRADSLLVWDEFEALLTSKKKLMVKVKEAVAGGLVTEYKGARVFIPASQVALSYVTDLKIYINQVLEIIIIEYDRESKKVVGSRKVIEQQKQERTKSDLMARISSDDRMSGRVVRLADYGAFVDLGGIDGLVHVSQMSSKRIKHPNEVLAEGDLVDVIVLAVDRERERISLKLADIKESPWENVDAYYQVGDLVKGKVTRLMSFGAFVEIEDGLEGLVHISELSDSHVTKVTEVVKIGDEVEAVILGIDSEAQKLSLSLKAASEVEEEYAQIPEEPVLKSTLSDLFGDKLKNLKF